jgi:enterochelin esterase-like enzyme
MFLNVSTYLMRRFFLLPLLLLASHAAEPDFPLTADSQPQASVPKGELITGSYTVRDGSVFPGTVREYQIYLPAGLDKTQPAAFMVFQDGVIYQGPVVFDNLIAKKDIPPLVGIFIKPGIVPAANDNALPRFNRSYEYDSITPTYSDFLINEFLPAIESKHGLTLSTDPNHAAISGNSSGGICAFMVAWHRPDRFHRIFTGVGTYVGIHGADQLPVLVRKFEPKPLRIFLQSGTGDNNLYCGDWWMANQMMERSLTWAGYDVNRAWGEGGHNAKHATQIFPEVLRWLWRDWQTTMEIKANPKNESKWKGYEVVGDGEWEKKLNLKSPSETTLRRVTSNKHGEVYAVREGGQITKYNGSTAFSDHGKPHEGLTDLALDNEGAIWCLAQNRYQGDHRATFVFRLLADGTKEERFSDHQMADHGYMHEFTGSLCIRHDGTCFMGGFSWEQSCAHSNRDRLHTLWL